MITCNSRESNERRYRFQGLHPGANVMHRFLPDFKTNRSYSSLFELFQSFFHLFDLVAAKAGPWSNKSESKAVKTAKRYYRIHARWKGPFPSALFLRLFDIITPGGGPGMAESSFSRFTCLRRQNPFRSSLNPVGNLERKGDQ